MEIIGAVLVIAFVTVFGMVGLYMYLHKTGKTLRPRK